jgi:transposase
MCIDRAAAERLYDSDREKTIEFMLRLDAKVDELTAIVARLTKNSSNSSKPPSSDITKPPSLNRAERRRDKKRKIGGQWGHQKWERSLWDESEVNTQDYLLTACPVCGGSLRQMPDEPPIVLQQAELATPAVEKIQHRAPAFWCPRCKRVHHAKFPKPVTRQGLLKTDLSALVCFLKYAGCMSMSGIKRYLADVADVRVTKGYIAKLLQKGARALESSYDQLLEALPLQAVVNADETGHSENGSRQWTWVFRSSMFALFKLSPSRGSDVLIDVLGREFNGALGCDYFSAYRKYMTDFNVTVQFCLAHLIRDVKFLVDFPDASVKRYGTKLLDSLRDLFHVIHQRDRMSPEKFTTALQRRKQAVLHTGTGYVPDRTEARNMAERLRKHGHEYFTFITTPTIDPTNNCAEQAIRFVVIHRKVTQGTRSIRGRIACERFFTVIATCAMQGRSAYSFIRDAFHRYFNQLPAPSLLPPVNSS